MVEAGSLSAHVLEVSYALGKAVSAELDMEALCDLVVEQVSKVFETETLALLFYSSEEEDLYVKRFVGSAGSGERSYRGSKGQGAAGVALSERRVVCLKMDDPALQDPEVVKPFVAPPSVVAVPLKPDPEPEPREAGASTAIPLMAEAKVKGVLALSWADPGRPSEQDLRLLEVIAAQTSVAFDNAWLYGEIKTLNESLEAKVRDRTAELNAKNIALLSAMRELKQTQAHLIQQEKMASLGQLTAGIAHEINNPLAYATSNVAMARERLEVLNVYVRSQNVLLEALESEGESRAIVALSYIEGLRTHPRYGVDVSEFLGELEGLGGAVRDSLCVQFLRYLRADSEAGLGPDAPNSGIERLLARTFDGLERVKQIVLDLRSFSRLDEAKFQDVDLDEGIASTLSIVEHLARERQVSLVWRPGFHATYACFPAKLNQVVLNLVTNGLQATPPGGCVEVKTAAHPEGPRISVSDTGKGIEAENLPHIFDPFFTTKPVGQGTGLGLSISYKIVQEHGGELEVSSELGAGTTFTIALPAQAG